jgi:hypothetical protein
MANVLNSHADKDRLLLISSLMFLKHWKKNNLNFVNYKDKGARNGPIKEKSYFISVNQNKLYCPFPGLQHPVI